MKKIQKVSLIGLGAIGAAYAGKFYDKDPESIKIIADRERVEKLKKGLVINDKLYNFRCVLPEEEGEPADLILVAVKFHHLEQTINVNCIAPGFIATDRLKSRLDSAGSEKYLRNVALGRYGTPEECAGVIEFLATDLSDYVTGAVINVNGGTTEKILMHK